MGGRRGRLGFGLGGGERGGREEERVKGDEDGGSHECKRVWVDWWL